MFLYSTLLSIIARRFNALLRNLFDQDYSADLTKSRHEYLNVKCKRKKEINMHPFWKMLIGFSGVKSNSLGTQAFKHKRTES